MKRHLNLLSSIFLFLLPTEMINGCGFFLHESQYRVFLLQPMTTNSPELGPFFYSPDHINYNALVNVEEPAREVNCKEWKAHCKYKGSWKDIYEVLYTISAREILYEPPRLLKEHPFIKHIYKHYKNEYVYLLFSRKAELVINTTDPWGSWQEHIIDSIAIRNFYEEGNLLHEKAKNSFVKMRTSYQLIKTAYYHPWLGYDADVIFKKQIATLRTTSWIKESARFYCIKPTYDAQYNYQLAMNFDKSIDKRFRCVQLFDQKQFKSVLKLAKNNHERAILYTMKELQNPGRSLNNLKRINELDSSNKDLPFLITREINKIEDWLLTSEFTECGPSVYIENLNHASDKKYAANLYDFITKMIASDKTNNEAHWELLAAHCAIVLNQMDKAAEHLNLCEKKATDPKIKFQVQLDKLLLCFDGKTKLQPAIETKILSFIKLYEKHKDDFFESKKIMNQFYLFVGKRLLQANDVAKGIFMLSKTNMSLGPVPYWDTKNPYVQMLEVAKPSDYDEAISLLSKKNKTIFEKFLAERSVYESSDWLYEGNTSSPDTIPLSISKLLDYKSMYYVQKDMLDSALACVNKIPGSYWKEHPYDQFQCYPFMTIFGTDNQSNNDFYVYNKRMFLQRMCDLKSLIKNNEGDIAHHHFLLASGYFNMGYHGNFWIMNMPYKASDELERNEPPLSTKSNTFCDNYYGCKMAEYHYLKAMNASNDSSFAALCIARASACNMNLQELHWFQKAHTSKKGYTWDLEFKPVYGKYRSRFINKFGNKDYYDDFVGSCYHYEHIKSKYF